MLSASQTNPDSLPQRFPTEDISNRFKKFALAGVIGVGGHQVGTEHWSVTHGIRATVSILDISNSNADIDYIPQDGSAPKPYKPFRFISAGYLFSVSYKF